MQRMGGGSRKRGGGNDPRCGCDMRVGWESSFGDVKQAGGSCNGSCSVAMVPQMGGANPVSFTGAVQHNNGSERTFRGTFNNATSAAVATVKTTPRNVPVSTVVAPTTNTATSTATTTTTTTTTKNDNVKYKALLLRGKRYVYNPVTFEVYHRKNNGSKGEQAGILNMTTKTILSNMMGGGCGCGLWKGGKTRKVRKGGAQDLSPAPVDFKGFGVTISDEKSQYIGKGGAQDLSPAPVDFKGFGVTISDEKGQYMGKGGAADCDFGCPFKGTGYCNFYAKGGANYGEPMPLQAKLRGGYLTATPAQTSTRASTMNGGGVNGCGCLTKPFFRGGSALINRMEDVLLEVNRFLQKYPILQPGAVVTQEVLAEMNEDKMRIFDMYDEVSQNINMYATNAEEAKQEELIEAENKMVRRTQMYTTAAQAGGYKPTKKNLKYLKRYRQGKSIGFTMKASLKAKGLIPRNSRKHKGKKIVSNKYK